MKQIKPDIRRKEEESMQRREMNEERFLIPMMDAPEAAGEFSAEELGADVDGMSLGFQRIKIPSGGVQQFELPSGDPEHPDYEQSLTVVVLHHHDSNVYWEDGEEYDENAKPLCSSVDGKMGYGSPGGVCRGCALNQYGTASNGSGKACKNMRSLYLLRNGDSMPMVLNLPPTSLKPWKEFYRQAFLFRRRTSWGSVIEIGLKKIPNGKESYSVATFKLIHDFTGEELEKIRAFAGQFKEQLKLILDDRVNNLQQTGDGCEYETAEFRGSNIQPYEIDGDREALPA